VKIRKLGFTLRSTVILSLVFCFGVALADLFPSRSSLSPGRKAPAFRATTIDGKTINFPADYKGKVVLLDFWATWCPPCRAELPKVVATYNKLHDQGFEVLSVSLDNPKKGPDVLQFIKDKNMAWPHIYDGHYWNTAVALQYGVRAIPCPVLVDGDTGTIIATDGGALGSRLGKAVETRLAAKTRVIADAKSN
jgi:peroxiredoxin